MQAAQVDGEGLTDTPSDTWTALGAVGHWGHVRRRNNRYEAVATVDAQDRPWKIVELEMRGEQRVDQATQC